jgi:hypothetical protein
MFNWLDFILVLEESLYLYRTLRNALAHLITTQLLLSVFIYSYVN